MSVTNYAANFLGGAGQLAALAAVLAVWLALAALGAAVAGRQRAGEAAPICGWALAAFAFTAAGVLTPVPFRFIAVGVGAAAVAAGAYAWRRDRALLAPGALKVAALAAPLLAIASALSPSQWDEFSHWLPSQRFLLEHDGFPDRAHAKTGASFPAYPYAWPLLGYLAGRVAGRLVDNAGAVFNVLLLLSFALLLARLVALAAGRAEAKDGRPWAPGWGLSALGVLGAAVASASQKVALTAYADTATGVALGFAAALGWLALEAEAGGRPPEARSLAWIAGLALAVLVSLKQATFVLFVVAVGGILLAGARDPEVSWRGLARLLPGLLAPPLALYLLWRGYVAQELAEREMGLRPLDEWFFGLIPKILARMALVAAKKGVYFGVMLAAVAVGLHGLVRFAGSLHRLAIVVASVFLGYNAFLFFSYVAAFGSEDALRAASYWRYNMHLAPLAVAFAAYALASLWRRHAAARLGGRSLASIPVALAVIAPLAAAPKLRFDREPPGPHLRRVAEQAAGLLSPATPFAVLDPLGSGESAMFANYHAGHRAPMVGYKARHDDTRAEALLGFLARARPAALLVHSVTPDLERALGLRLAPGASYLLRREDAGGWQVVAAWPNPGGIAKPRR
jgi:hypothetical protein